MKIEKNMYEKFNNQKEYMIVIDTLQKPGSVNRFLALPWMEISSNKLRKEINSVIYV
jgi:hypothetical protein